MLITIFISVQWTATHVHLAKHHDHDGSSLHQHNIQVHAHHVSSHHADAIDFAPAMGDYKVVELDNDGIPGGKKTDNQQAVTAYHLLFVIKSSRTFLPEQERNSQKYITYSTIRLRAPPQFS